MNVAKEGKKAFEKLMDSDQRTMVLDKLMPHLEPEERLNVARWMHSQGMIILRTRPLAPSYMAMLPEIRIPYRAEAKQENIEKKVMDAVGVTQAKTYRELVDITGVSGRPLKKAIEKLKDRGILKETLTDALEEEDHIMHIYTHRTPQEKIGVFNPMLRAIHLKIEEVRNRIRRGRIRGWEQVVKELGEGNWKAEHKHPRLPTNLHIDLWEKDRRIAVELKMWNRQEVTALEARRFINKVEAVQPEEAYYYAPKMTREGINLLRNAGITYRKLRRDDQ